MKEHTHKTVQKTIGRKVKPIIHYSISRTENWSNNSGLEEIVETLAKLITDNNPSFQETEGYKNLLEQFCEYYDLDQNSRSAKTIEALKKLLTAYVLPQERFMIVSPVLRKMVTGNAHSCSLLTQMQLQSLCESFNFGINIFLYQEHSISPSLEYTAPNALGAASLTLVDNQWFRVYKNEAAALEERCTNAYSPNQAFLKPMTSVTHDRVALRRLQAGISSFLKTGILYNETNVFEHGNDTVSGWKPLHQAVYQDKIEVAAKLLREGANWRLSALMDGSNRKKSIGKTLYSSTMSALEIAVVRGDRQMVSLILQYSDPVKDHEIVQQAYDKACTTQFGKIIYAFQSYPNLIHPNVGLRCAVAAKDLALFMMLRNNGASLRSTLDKNSSILQQSFKEAINDLEFGVALLNMTLLSWHQELISKKSFRLSDFRLQEVDLGVVSAALAAKSPQWINRLIKYYHLLPKMLDRETDLAPIFKENIVKINCLIAEEARGAITETNPNRLIDCFIASDGCLQIDGKLSLLHHALKQDNEKFLKEVYVSYRIEMAKLVLGDALSDSQQVQIRKEALEYLDIIAEGALDQFGRTYAYRLERATTKKQLHQDLKQSQSWLKTFRCYSQLQLFAMNELRTHLFDAHFEKMRHNSTIQSSWVATIGYSVLPVIKAINAITPLGLAQAGLGLVWTFVLPQGKKVVFKHIGEAGAYVANMIGSDPDIAAFYTSYVADNIITFTLMPDYYLASTVMSNGVYYGFKDSGYDNAEAFAHVFSDGITQSLLAGSGSNYVLDEKYYHRLNNQLKPFFGEYTSMVAPIVSTVDSVSNKANKIINAPFNAIRPYLSASVLESMASVRSFETSKMLTDTVGHLHVAKQRVFNLAEEALLGIMSDSVFKNERLHALQMFETNRLYSELYQLNKQFEEANSQETVESQAAVASQQRLIDTALKQEELLYQNTEGSQYRKLWEEKYLAFKAGEVDKRLTAQQLSHLKEEASQAWEKCQFYNSDPVTDSAKQWGEHVDGLFTASKDNFLDQTNILGEINYIINVAFETSSDRNTIARMIADGYIRKNYPLYPGAGDKAQIEVERLKIFQEITNDKLKGYSNDSKKIKNRLYNYLFAKLTSTPEKHHIPRHQRILKPIVNELVGKTIGYIPYPEFKGGRTGHGGAGLQVSKPFGQATQAAITLAGEPVYNLRGGAKPESMELSWPKPQVKAPAVIDSKLAANDSASLGSTKIDMDSPYMKNILATQYKETLGAKVESVGKRAPVELPMRKTIGKKSLKLADAQTAFRELIPKVAIPGEKANWFKMVSLSAQGKGTTEIRDWQKCNIESKQLPFIRFIKDIGTSVKPVTDFMSEVLVESYDEMKDSLKLIEQFSFHEIDLALSGEELQTERAVKILGVFIGSEAARLTLKEPTATSQYMKQVAADFKELSDRDKAKAAIKIFIAYKLPAVGLKLINKAGTVSVQRVAQIKDAVPRAGVGKVVVSPIVPKIPKTVTGGTRNLRASEPASILTMYEQKSITKLQSFREIVISRSTPAEIYHGYGKLSKRQSAMLLKLPQPEDFVIIKKSGLSVSDLAALTSKTGDEFAMFTLGSRRLIIRGDCKGVSMSFKLLDKIKTENWKWSAHVHPGTSDLVLNASGFPGDRQMLTHIQQERSLILNSSGRRNVFDKHDNQLISGRAKKSAHSQTKEKAAWSKLKVGI